MVVTLHETSSHALRSPEHLQLCRVRCCTPEASSKHMSSKISLITFGMLMRMVFHFVPRQGRSSQFIMYAVFMKSQVIHRSKSLPSVQQMLQVTQYHPCTVFLGRELKAKGCVDKAYFGRSPKGWISTELFYGWLANHFAK